MKLPVNHRLIHFDNIDSTNAEASRLASRGETGPLWIWADQQSKGRGRLGRTWISAPGNLYVTHLLSTEAAPAMTAQLTFVASLAVLDMARTFEDPGVISLKWPNDVLKHGAKFCGILPEMLGRGVVAVGMGINLEHCPQNTPYPVTSLGPIEPSVALERLAEAFAQRFHAWDHGRGFSIIREAWLAFAAGLGGQVEANGLSGVYTGLGSDGALLLTMGDGQTRSVHAGEVRIIDLKRTQAMA